MPPKGKPEGFWADQPFKLLDTPGKDKPLSDPVVYVASLMTLVHNTFIRSLNTIYQHAPLISGLNTSLAHDLLTYCSCWSSLLLLHHSTEEQFLFPALEQRIPSAKSAGILSVNIKQHEEFHTGLEAFESYVEAALAGKEKYDGEKLVKLIDGFAGTLMTHFEEEVVRLMGLGVGDKKAREEVMKVHEEFEVRVRKDIDSAKVAPMTLLNADKTFEGGKHPFPVMPKFVPYLIKYLVSRKHAGAWKFGSCDYWGQPVTLFMYTPEGKRALAVGKE